MDGRLLLALAEPDSNTWVSEVDRIPCKKQTLTAASLHALRHEYTLTLAPSHALAAEALPLAHPQRVRQPGVGANTGGEDADSLQAALRNSA